MKTAVTILFDDDYVVNGKKGGWAWRIDQGDDIHLMQEYAHLVDDMDYCLEEDAVTRGEIADDHTLMHHISDVISDIRMQLLGIDTRKKNETTK